ncbi:MAG: LPS export ABC transporter permease LptG [Pseudomonadales bacterium]|nr:LPS export ABC transporter permease LptG [Pseudomonadales bacterium]
MNVLNRYVSRTVFSAILMVLVVLVGLNVVAAVLSDLSKLTGDFTFWVALQVVLLELPSNLYRVMPMASMVGCLVGLGALANSSELVVMRSAGISTYRMTWMALRPAILITVAAVLMGEFIAPKTDYLAGNIMAVARSGEKKLDVSKVVWFREGENFIFADVVHASGIIYGLNILEFDDDDALKTIKYAKRATFQQDHWLLEDLVTTRFMTQDGQVVQAEQITQDVYRWYSDLKPELLNIAAVEPRSLPIGTLWKYSHYLKKQNLNAIEYELAFWEKVLYPLVMVSLVLVGIAFVFGPLREVTMGYRVFTGVVMGVIFSTFQQALGPVSIVYGFSPLIAMSVPAIVCGLLGLILLARVR